MSLSLSRVKCLFRSSCDSSLTEGEREKEKLGERAVFLGSEPFIYLLQSVIGKLLSRSRFYVLISGCA